MNRPSIIGLVSVLIVIGCTFLPWVTIESKQLVFSGLNTTGSSFGEPGKLSIGVGIIAIILFVLRGKWPARLNLFVTAFLAAWTFRNFILFSRCEMGVCPDRQIGLYLSLLAAIAAFVAVLFTGGRKTIKN